MLAEGSTQAQSKGDAVLDLLATLRESQYRPSAWARFIAQSWRMARAAADAHPHLVRSWRRVVVCLTLAEATALGTEALIGGPTGRAAATRAAPGAALCLAYTLGDAYAHLGMNHTARGEPLRNTVGLPTLLTLTRGATAGFLFGHLLGRAPASNTLLALALMTAGLTDITDGQIARRTRRTTRLGAYLDGETDFGVALALTLTLAARRALPRWVAAVLLARWLSPFSCAVFAYFGPGYRMPISSTVLGKVAGVAQTATLGMALLPAPVQRRASGAQKTLHSLMAALLVMAPLAQLAQFAQVLNSGRREERQRRGQR